jgi:ATP/maltotriose-dependent transcriptional regulator MalT
MVAIWCDALCEVRLGDVARVAALAEDMQALVEEFALAQGRAPCQWFRGWAEARRGEPSKGYRRIREGYETNIRVGMMAGGSETLGYGAEALVRAGDWDAAQRELREAFQHAEKYAERVYLPQLHLIEAAIARGRGQADAARAAAARAVAEARAQEAPWLEQLALKENSAGAAPEAP